MQPAPKGAQQAVVLPAGVSINFAVNCAASETQVVIVNQVHQIPEFKLSSMRLQPCALFSSRNSWKCDIFLIFTDPKAEVIEGGSPAVS